MEMRECSIECKELSLTLLVRKQQHKKEERGYRADIFFLGLEHMASMPDIVAETDGMADAGKEKWLTTKWTRKNKQGGQRGKSTRVPLCFQEHCPMLQNVIASHRLVDCKLSVLTTFSTDSTFGIIAILSGGLLFVYCFSKEGGKKTTNWIHDAYIQWRRCYCYLFLAQFVAIGYIETEWNSSSFILEAFPINILSRCKSNDWGWHFNKLKSKLFKTCPRKLGWALSLGPWGLKQVTHRNYSLACVVAPWSWQEWLKPIKMIFKC